ncbi:P-loop NTPase fold protein, partial [Liquorilactobacillus uvarum]
MKTDFLKLPSDGNIYSFENKTDSFSYSLYRNKLEKFQNIFKEICSIDNKQIESRIIGILGNRGSGKTSFLKVAVNKIKEEKHLKTLILDPIDPSIMDDQLNILELIVSKIASEAENEKINRIDTDSFFGGTDSFEYKLNNFYEQLEKVNKTLSSLRIDRKDLAKGLSSTSFKEDLKNKVGFIEQINCLIDRFVSLKGEKDLKVVCVIDDLDLISNRYIVKEIEMLSKFIAYTKLVIILAYRPKQLENTLLAEKINENKILLDEGIINVNELEDRVNNQLSKLIPHNHQISLPEQSVAMAKPMYDYLKDFLIEGRDIQEVKNLLTCIDLSDGKHKNSNSDFAKLSVKEWLNRVIFNTTGLTFEPTKNSEFYDDFFTKNLRDLVQFLKVIFDMDTIENDSTIGNVEISEVVNKKIKNIEKFESYLNLMSKNVLPSNLIEVYKKIKNSDIREHNYVVYREIFNLLNKLENET